MTALLSVDAFSVCYGKRKAVEDVSFTLPAGTVTGLIGPNGAGKTTLIDALTGFVPSCGGKVMLRRRRIDSLAPHQRFRRGLARTFQSLELFEDLSVAENLAVAGDEPAEALGLGGIAARLPATLSHDERAAVAIGRALAGRPRVLLLDEPAAGMDATARATLAGRLRELAADGHAVLVVEHDVALVFEVCDAVIVLDGGKVVAHGRPADVRADPAVRAAYLGGRPAQGKVAGTGTGAQGWVPPTGTHPHPRPTAPGADRRDVLAVERAARPPVIQDVSLTVDAGEIVALLGPNGAGKTTLIRMIANVLPPAGGRVTVLGEPTHRVAPALLARRGVAVVPQGRGSLPGLTVRENLRLAAGRRLGHRSVAFGADRPETDTPADRIASTLEWFPALRPLLDRAAGGLSGGERQQLALAAALARRPALLLVDEFSFGLAPNLVPPLLAILRRAADSGGMGILLVEQHAWLALSVADRGYVLDRGRVALTGTTEELTARPELIEASYLGSGPGAPP